MINNNNNLVLNFDKINESLIVAAYEGNFEKLKFFLDKNSEFIDNIDINTTNDYGLTPLLISCLVGHTRIVDYLLNSKELKTRANPFHLTNNDRNILMLTITRTDNVELLNWLLNIPGINENISLYDKDKDGNNLLLIAAKLGHYKTLDYLVLEKEMIVDSAAYAYIEKNLASDYLYKIKQVDLKRNLNNSLMDKNDINKPKKI